VSSTAGREVVLQIETRLEAKGEKRAGRRGRAAGVGADASGS
jgi:hypothetical protein